jgi:glycosyltransferase involved in cell wall biosynthesis
MNADMPATAGALDRPLVSVVLTTRDRPRLLPVALACYRHQTCPNRELIVVDDGDRVPADEAAVEAAGGRLIRVPTGLPLGEKLNRGASQARGWLCQKMDDDDWYGPDFLRTMVDALLDSWRVACRPTVAFVAPFLFFDLARWEVRRSLDNNVPGATLLFRRDDWAERPFRALPGDEDFWFLRDQASLGASPLLVRGVESFVAIRHGGAAGRGHTWVRQASGETLEAYLLQRPLHPGGPEALFPSWALDVYRSLRPEAGAGIAAAR